MKFTYAFLSISLLNELYYYNVPPSLVKIVLCLDWPAPAGVLALTDTVYGTYGPIKIMTLI